MTLTLAVVLHSCRENVAPNRTNSRVGSVVLRVLLVLVERHHLVQNWFGHRVQGGQLVRSDCHLHIVQFSDDWLELRVVNSIQWLDHLQVIILLLVFVNRGFDWSKVLLITEVNVIEQGTLAWQECAS